MTDALLHGFSLPSKSETDFINIVSAKDCTLVDDQGKQYLDAMASLWLCQIGHGNSKVVNAIKDQLDRLQTYNTFDPFTNTPASQAAEAVRRVSPHPNGRVFLGCSGSEAVDSALKLSRMFHQRRGDSDRQIIVRRNAGYHGVNVGGTSVQGIEPNRVGWGDLLPHVIEIPNDDIEEAATLFAEHGSRIAAVICEPVQGAGGVIVPPDGYLPGLRRLCDQHGSLLIFDEVICGFGRTGQWFASQTFDVTPDMITFAKGVTSGYLPLSGVIISEALNDELVSDEAAKLMHGYTYSGHPTAAAAAIANLEVIESENLVGEARRIGDEMHAGFSALLGDEIINSFRGIGGIWACEIGKDAIPARDMMISNGVVCRGIGEALAFCPPLIITDDEIGQIFDTLSDVLRGS
ncbi:MAG: aminotransferase class III-fold pyridoxal phosphate-dependent enzyme [Acidimicrobiales bacterium]|nr:aminotransferase class III-fold pyridoxal phosphate-dependent enzyme [Acidimicrobiales bacterium]MEC9113423.1 aminotransferase class III-fold pyridoxal phosphate-dependent enzyme [Actinomycetota bacterium]|tara:strand:- start:138 stop:1352 length:1215 start_codon:yes stop_codon:yes gene_type:complete